MQYASGAVLNGSSPGIALHLRVRRGNPRRHVELQSQPVAAGPAPANRKILPIWNIIDSGPHLLHFRRSRPARYAHMDCELGRLRWHDGQPDIAYFFARRGALAAGITSRRDQVPNPLLQAPAQLGILEQLNVDGVFRGAVEIAGNGCESTLQIERAAVGGMHGLRILSDEERSSARGLT